MFKVFFFLKLDQTAELRAQRFYSSDLVRVSNILKPISRSSQPYSLIRRLKRSFCSDERDRVYAILGLISGEYRIEIVPDYTKSLQEVNKEFLLCMLKMQTTVRLSGGLEEHKCGSTSWSPDFSHTLPTLDLCCAAGLSKHEIVYERLDESLRLPAKAISTIAAIWFSVPGSYATHDILRLFRAHAQPSMRDRAYPLGGNILDAYVCSLAGGQYHEISTFPWVLPLQELRDLVQGGDFSEQTLRKAKISFGCTPRRAIFSTSDGLIGLCPRWGKLGDKLYVTLGVETAILLSRVEGRSNHYRLRGECYVHGLMYSQALLGPLPASEVDWEIQVKRVQNGLEVVFNNDEVTTQNDPRLGPLPEGWKKLYRSERENIYDDEFDSDGRMRRLLFQNISTTEIQKNDPRMTSTALKARGVKFEDIIII